MTELPLQVAQEAGDGWTRARGVTAQHARQTCLAKSRGPTPEVRRNWRDGIYGQIREVMLLQGSLSIDRMCRLVPVSGRSFYRSLQEQQHRPRLPPWLDEWRTLMSARADHPPVRLSWPSS